MLTSQTGGRGSPQPPPWPPSAPYADADYDDTFSVDARAATDRPAEEWMRDALEGAPAFLRWVIRLGWRWVLGFHPSPAPSILGWRISDASNEWVVLEQQSRLLGAALLMRVQPDKLTWATRVSYRARGAVVLWTVVGVIHRRVVPYVLQRSAVRGQAAR